jgi:hypothetical protein
MSVERKKLRIEGYAVQNREKVNQITPTQCAWGKRYEIFTDNYAERYLERRWQCNRHGPWV